VVFERRLILGPAAPVGLAALALAVVRRSRGWLALAAAAAAVELVVPPYRAWLERKAGAAGETNADFKSDTFPLER
jgi:hypothetical protein